MVEKVLVTGGAGFIGSHIVDKLIADGYEVVVFDDLSAGKLGNIRRHSDEPDFRFVRGDVRDARVVERALEGADAVIHEAALVSVPLSTEKPALTNEVNVLGTLNLLRGSLKAGVRRFVYASSCAVYGAASRIPISEDAPLKPLSLYGESKLAAEGFCQTFYHEHGLETVRLRYFNVYGPRQAAGEYAGVMLKFLERIRRDQPPIIFGDGEQTRDFIHVSDVVEATMLALNRRGVAGEVFNIGTGEATTINRLCEIFLELAGKTHLKPIYSDAKPGDIRHSLADITKARQVLGFRPKVSLEEGVKKLTSA
ncbi:MAG: SDR family oxidoreductase [Candidatus Hodarchaeaceae archaeon]|nr:SDR family oxidoreductase [Candidatus Hodarchaeaceae archaeon]